jgi:fructosamine-3-kinase
METLIRTGIIQTGWPQEVFWPVLTFIAIRIYDLAVKAEHHGQGRVAFTDDIIVEGKVKDATSLIRFLRDSLCHVESSNKTVPGTTNLHLSFAVRHGKGGMINFGGTPPLSCDYEDEIAFFWGSQRIYWQRHLLRAFHEAVANLQGFLKKVQENRS